MQSTPAERAALRRATATVRILRPGDPMPDDEPDDSSPSERMEAVWRLTLECLAWRGDHADEPRLQRSVVRVRRRSPGSEGPASGFK